MVLSVNLFHTGVTGGEAGEGLDGRESVSSKGKAVSIGSNLGRWLRKNDSCPLSISSFSLSLFSSSSLSVLFLAHSGMIMLLLFSLLSSCLWWNSSSSFQNLFKLILADDVTFLGSL